MKKSAAKSAPGRPFTKGGDPRQGRGPAPGALNAGRPPSEVARAYRASFEARLGIAEAICDDPGASDMARLKALELLGRFGGMLSVQLTGENGASLPAQTIVVGGRTIRF